MGVISRGFKNAFRNTIRTISLTFILGLSIAMALIMFLSLKTVQAKIDSVKSSIGNTLTISPAGVRGFEGGGELLTELNASDIANISHVTQVTKSTNDRLTQDDNTSLASSIEPGSFGGREQNRQRRSFDTGLGNLQQMPANVKMPITLTGTNNLDSLSSIGASQFNITSGEKINAESEDYIAMLGTDLALKNNISVGGIFKAYDQEIKVVGIYDAGNKFSNSGLVMPIKTVQKLSGQSDQINSMVVKIDSMDNISEVENQVKQKIGDNADIVSSQDTSSQAIKPLENIKTISLYSLIGSLVAGAMIIFLTMIMIVRERRREIGVLKAIGSSNLKIVSQFAVESLTLTLLSSVIGVFLGFVFSNPVLKLLVANSETATDNPEKVGQFERGGQVIVSRFNGGVSNIQNIIKDIHAVVGIEMVLYGLFAAIIIAILGSAIPSFLIAKIRPAEVMRSE